MHFVSPSNLYFISGGKKDSSLKKNLSSEPENEDSPPAPPKRRGTSPETVEFLKKIFVGGLRLILTPFL